MKKKLSVLLVINMIPLFVFGQSISKQINDIKRSSKYICAEATLETETEAYKLAEELLADEVSKFSSGQKSLKGAQNVIVKDVAGKAEKLQMNRGTMTRVFLYVKKSDIIAADNTRVLIQPQITAETKKTTVRSEKKSEKTFVSQIESVNGTNANNTDIHPLNLPIKWQQEVIDDLLSCLTNVEAMKLMNRLQAEHKLKKYGAANSCQNPEHSFWLIFDEQGKIITILGEGQSVRTNFRTQTKEELSKYSGMGAIWFTLSK